jgi:hypothetical protein
MSDRMNLVRRIGQGIFSPHTHAGSTATEVRSRKAHSTQEIPASSL